MSDPSTERIAQSTLVIQQLLEKLPIEEILKFRVSALKLHKQQLDLIDSILAQKGYNGPLE